MPHFFIKLYLFIFTIILCIAGLLLLLTNHSDQLAKYVPNDAETYFHCELKDFLALKPDWQFAFVNYLSEHSALTYSDWRAVIEAEPSELAIFSLNGQFFLLVPDDKGVRNLLDETKISRTRIKNAVFFPEIAVDPDTTQKNWIKEASPAVNFSQFLFLGKDMSKFSWPLTVEPNDSFSIKANIKGSRLDLKLTNSKPMPMNPEGNTKVIKLLPNETKIYLHNISKDLYSYEAESTPDNLTYLLLKSLNVAEFYLPAPIGDSNHKFAMVFDKSTETPANIEKVLAETLAKMFPLEQTKELPDRSSATHLIADTEQWQFHLENGRKQLIKPDLSLAFELYDQPDQLILVSNITEGDLFLLKNLVYQDSRISLCPIASQRNSIFVNPGILGIKDINNLFIEQKSTTKFSICID